MKFTHEMLIAVNGRPRPTSSRAMRFSVSTGTMLSTLLMVVIVLNFAVRSSVGVRWLSIASAGTAGGQEHIRVEDECEKLQGLVKKQKVICKKNVDMMDAVKSGALIAIQECQQQFASRRWNCSTVNAVTIFGKIHNSGIREMAFVHAISSAGVAHAVTKACSSGMLDRCGCDKTVADRITSVPGGSTSSAIGLAVTASGSGISSSTQSQYVSSGVETNHLPRNGAWLTSGAGGGPTGGTGGSHAFEWSGCSDNVAYGSAFAKLFVDAKEKARGRDAARALMNLHNNNAGRRAVEDAMRIQCKCHGVSGSCEIKTCWRSLAPFRDVGNILKDKYNGATEVEQKVVGGTRRELVPISDDFKPPTDADLVYLDQSPDFCEYDQRTGSLGTRGRTCNKTSKAIDGCELMCCGRGYQEIRRNIVERCKCKFHWCCYVQCKRCSRTVTEYVCR